MACGSKQKRAPGGWVLPQADERRRRHSGGRKRQGGSVVCNGGAHPSSAAATAWAGWELTQPIRGSPIGRRAQRRACNGVLAGAAPAAAAASPHCTCPRCRRSRWSWRHQTAAAQSRACGSARVEGSGSTRSGNEGAPKTPCAGLLSRMAQSQCASGMPTDAWAHARAYKRHPPRTSKSCRLIVGAAARTMVAQVL